MSFSRALSPPTMAIPDYITDKKESDRKKNALWIFQNSKITHPVGSGCLFCRRQKIPCVEGPNGTCARCAVSGIRYIKCDLPKKSPQPYLAPKRSLDAEECTEVSTASIKRPRTMAQGINHADPAVTSPGLDHLNDVTGFDIVSDDQGKSSGNASDVGIAGALRFLDTTLAEMRRSLTTDNIPKLVLDLLNRVTVLERKLAELEKRLAQ